MADVPLDYTAADYPDIRFDILRRAETLIPQWTSRSEADFGVVMAELFSHAADLNNYAIDRLLRESFLPTAATLRNVLLLADMLGYVPHAPVGASGTITFITDAGGPAVTVPAGTRLVSVYNDDIDEPLYFETVDDVTVPGDGGTADIGIVEGRTTVKREIGMSNGQPNQRIFLPQLRILQDSVRIYVQDTNADIEWAYVPRLTYSSPGDLVFTVRPDASGATVIVFGDGVTGYVPPLGAKLYATYRTGVGALGNLASGQIGVIESPIAGVTVAHDANGRPQSTAVTGGTDAESIEDIRRNAAAAYAAFGRAVTVEDYGKIALTVPGVIATHAISAVASSVTVYIAGPGRSVPTPELTQAVADQLHEAGAAGVRITVEGPTIVSVNFGTVATPLQLTVAPNFRNNVVETAVRARLTQLMSSPDNGFGSRISVGEVYSALAAIPGVVNIVIPMMARADAAQTGISDIVLAPWELPILGTVKITPTGGVV